MRKIKSWLEEIRESKHVHSDDLEKIIRRCLTKYRDLFPDYCCTKNGSRTVHHFNVKGVAPISIERPHGSREYIPRAYATKLTDGIDDLVNYIEMNCKGESYDYDSDDPSFEAKGESDQ